MGVNSLPKTVTRQRRGCDLNPGPSAPESSTLTTRLPSHPKLERRELKASFTRGTVTRLVEVEQRCLGGVYGMRMSDKCDGVLEKKGILWVSVASYSPPGSAR